MATMEELTNQVQQLYVSYYGRPGDPAGVDFWVSYFMGTDNVDQALAAFGESDEFVDNFGDLSTTELINGLYQQMFNRDADPTGLAFYTALLDSGAASLASIALDIANGAKNDDVIILANKITVANEYTVEVEDTSAPYGDFDISAAQALLAAVDETAASVVIGVATVDDTVAANQGSEPAPEPEPPPPPNLAPSMSSIAVNAAGDIEITYSEDVSTSVVEAGDYVVTVNGGGAAITGAAVAAKVVTLTMTTKIEQSDTANSVVYTAVSGTADSIEDSTGKVAIDQTISSVTNNSTVDTVDPTILSSVPADGDLALPTANNITITFSENIQVGTGNVTLNDVTGGGATETFNIATGVGDAGGTVSISGAVLTINPFADLADGNAYAVQIDATAIDDNFTRSFAGIADNTTLNFSASTATEVTTVGEWNAATGAVIVTADITVTANAGGVTDAEVATGITLTGSVAVLSALTTISGAGNLTVNDDATIAEATTINNATNSGTKSVATITDSAANIAGSSDVVIANSAGAVTANTAATIAQANAMSGFATAVVYNISDVAANIASNTTGFGEAVNVTITDDVTIAQALTISTAGSGTKSVATITDSAANIAGSSDAVIANSAGAVTANTAATIAQANAMSGFATAVVYNISDVAANIASNTTGFGEAVNVTITDDHRRCDDCSSADDQHGRLWHEVSGNHH